jgi:hypothetical protein
MSVIKATKLYRDFMGLTNQIYVLVSNILDCIQTSKKILIIGDFLKEVQTNSTISITEILDLRSINDYLYKKHNLIIVYANRFDLKINNVYYGTTQKNINITQEFMSLLKKESNKVSFSKTINLNNIKGDICPNQLKKIFIHYSVDNYLFYDEYDEYDHHLKEDIVYDFNIYDFCDIKGWGVNANNEKKFTTILKNISFHPCFNHFVLEYMQNNFSLSTDKINVLHIRVEEDAIYHWSKINNMDLDTFREKIVEKYIHIISTHVNKTDKNIILSWSQSNKVIQFMVENGYDVHFLPKDSSLGRDVNAIHDFCVSKFCNHVFVGNYNPHMKQTNGSTFSYYISKTLNPSVKQILVELEHIEKACFLYYNNG